MWCIEMGNPKAFTDALSGHSTTTITKLDDSLFSPPSSSLHSCPPRSPAPSLLLPQRPVGLCSEKNPCN